MRGRLRSDWFVDDVRTDEALLVDRGSNGAGAVGTEDWPPRTGVLSTSFCNAENDKFSRGLSVAGSLFRALRPAGAGDPTPSPGTLYEGVVGG